MVVRTPVGQRKIYKTVNSGGSFGANPLRQEIGLGDATAIDRVQIFWPATGKTQVLQDLTIDRAYKVTEGQETAEELKLPVTPFKLTQSHDHMKMDMGLKK